MTIIPTVSPQGYIGAPVTVNPNVLFQQAVADIQAQYPGWTPYAGQLDVAVLMETAQMASVSAAVAAQVMQNIFKYFGPLVNIDPILGTQASAAALITMRTSTGYTIPAGTQVAYPLSGSTQVLFTVKTTVIIPSGQTTGTCTLICKTVGVFANGLVAETCQLVTPSAQILSIATTAMTSGGVNADTSTSYMNRLSNELQLLAPRPILALDYAAMAPNVTGVFRALGIDGLNPGRKVTNGATTNTSTTVTSASGAFTSAKDVGRKVTGSGIPSTTVISSVTNSTTIVISHAATITATGVTLTFGDLTTQQRYVTVCGLTTTGTALSTSVNTAMQQYLNAKREVNFVVATISPTYTSIDVTVTCDAQIGATTSAVQSAVAASIRAFLSKATWGGGANQLPVWTPAATVVRYLDVANAIRTTPGVLFIPSGSLTTRVHGGSMAKSDITLPGDAPLPTVGTILVTVNAA